MATRLNGRAMHAIACLKLVTVSSAEAFGRYAASVVYTTHTFATAMPFCDCHGVPEGHAGTHPLVASGDGRGCSSDS